MGKIDFSNTSGNGHVSSGRQVTVEELEKHNKKTDQWLTINNKVYNVTEFAKRHPGGAKILNHFAGEDATDAWVAFHNDKEKVGKYMKAIYVGELVDAKKVGLFDKYRDPVMDDFRQLRKLVEDSGWMQPEPIFYALHFVHIIALELLAVGVLWYFGTSWPFVLLAMLLMATSQAQAGWTQHDYGHHSVFKSMRWAHVFHHLTVGFIKGASSHWWNFRHFQHHAKPNMIRKDPDVDISYLFLIGDMIPKKWGERKWGKMPYQLQQSYWFLIGPPLLLPIYFHLEVIYFVFKRRDWLDLAIGIAFFHRLGYFFGPFFGGWGTFFFYMGVRFFESHWFTWVTQMSHLPMEVDTDKQRNWVSTQLRTTCNVDPSPFNDWFTGHLNYQIEHHLFPTMPRVNYYKVKPLVMSLCEKHGIQYRSKTLYNAFADIYRMLKKSGKIWYDAYHE